MTVWATFAASVRQWGVLGVWLPRRAGPAPWETTAVRFASVRVWQYDDPGDVRGVLLDDIDDIFGPDDHWVR